MYTIDKERTRANLPICVLEDFDGIVNQTILGASTHIRLIGNMIEEIVKDSIQTKDSTKSMICRIQDVTQFFIHTRGEASQAITNAIYQMTQGLSTYQDDDCMEVVAKKIIKVKCNYEKLSKHAIEQAVSYAIEIGNEMHSILLYDYSSSVEACIVGLQSPKNLYIAESRAINGGYPFVEACSKAGHSIHFIPDASLMYYIKECDGVFMGAETIYPDGTGFNTIGSDIVGLLCDYFKIPLYFITPLVKLDARPVYGKNRELVINDLDHKLACIANPSGLCKGIKYTTPELIGVKANFITAYITEQGVIPSTQMYSIGMTYIQSLRGETYV